MSSDWKRWSSKSQATVLLACLMSLVVACTGDTSTVSTTAEASETTAAGLTTIRVGLIPIAAMAPLYLADEEGLFQDRGVEVEFVELGQTDAGALIESGDIDVGLEITGAGLLARAAGVDMVAVFQNEVGHDGPPDSGAILVRPDSGIDSLDDLADTTIAGNQLQSQTQIAAQHVLRNAGVPPEDYEYLEIPLPNLNDALANEQVDAVVNVDPFTTQAIASGIGTPISWYFVESLPSQPIGIFWASSTWIEENPEAVVAFDEAVTEAHEMLNADPDFAREKIAEYTGLEADLLSEMPPIGWDNEVRLDKWEELIDMLLEEEALPEAVDPRSVMSEQMQTHIVDG